MKMKKILSICCISCILLNGCGKKEINTLKAENQQLKNTIAQLQEEIKSLKETDQGYFSSAVEKFNTANNKQQWQEVANDFKVFGQKFPQSPYIAQAQSYVQQATSQVNKLQRIDDGIDKINNSVQKQHWKTARQTLQSIKSSLSTERYEQLKNYIYEESHKPIQTTINEIVSDKYNFIGKRVRVPASFHSSVDRNRKELTAYNSGCHEGSDISVFYNKTPKNTIQRFTNNNPDCYNQRWQVVGTVEQYSNSYDIYIQAESIQ